MYIKSKYYTKYKKKKEINNFKIFINSKNYNLGVKSRYYCYTCLRNRPLKTKERQPSKFRSCTLSRLCFCYFKIYY